MTSSKSAVSFHDAPSENKRRYADVIARAKSAQEVPVLSNTPRFDSLPKAPQQDNTRPPPAKALSPETVQGLLALQPTEEAPSQEEAPPTREEQAEVAKVEKDEQQEMREAVESRMTPLDIAQFFMSGEMSQTVVILPGKLTVEFRTVSDYEETFVDLQLANEDELKSSRQLQRREMEWAIALHVAAVNSTPWPKHVKKDGSVDKEAALERLAKARRMAGPVFTMLAQNLGWFLDRVNKALTMEALKNG